MANSATTNPRLPADKYVLHVRHLTPTPSLAAAAAAPPTAPDRATRAPIDVSIAELEEIARTLDAEDAADKSRSPKNFLTRLRSVDGDPVFSVLAPRDGKLKPTSTISLDGLSHMIGLPGAGKSTSIFLLVVLLSRQGRRSQRRRHLQHGRLVPASQDSRKLGLHSGLRRQIRRHGRWHRPRRGGSVRLWPAARAGGRTQRQAGQRHDHRRPPPGHLADRRR